MSYYEGFYDLFDINKEEKTIEYDVCLINGQKYNVKVMAERVEEEIMEKDLVKLQGGYNAMDEDSLQDNFLNVSKLNLKQPSLYIEAIAFLLLIRSWQQNLS